MEKLLAPRSRMLFGPALALCLLALPATAAGQAQSPSAPNAQAMVQRCKEHWVPACVNYGVPDPNKKPEVSNERPDDSNKKPDPFACAIAWKPGCPGEAEAARSLIQAGPSTGAYPTPLAFSARGFLQSGWPIVVKYRVPPGAIPTLTVTP